VVPAETRHTIAVDAAAEIDFPPVPGEKGSRFGV
jgi:hypothetical protein